MARHRLTYAELSLLYVLEHHQRSTTVYTPNLQHLPTPLLRLYKYHQSQMDPRDELPPEHRAVYSVGRSVWSSVRLLAKLVG